MEFEYKVIIQMRRVLKWNSRVLGEPVNTVMGEAPGRCRDKGRPLIQPAMGRKVVREESSGIEMGMPSYSLKSLCCKTTLFRVDLCCSF